MQLDGHQPDHDQPISRRALIQRASAWGMGVSAAWLLAACGGNKPEAPLAEAQDSDVEGVCGGDLSALDRVQRQGLSYVDDADDPSRRCELCRFFKPDESGGGCGRCDIVPGGIAANGTCSAWAATG